MKTDQIGGSQWNISGGNSKNFIRPPTCHQVGTLCSESNEQGNARKGDDSSK
jgi:hypothetical protein